MAQNAHVPKFGDWESEDIPYTACFDHARQQIRPSGSVKFNPNDPEENPEAFAATLTQRNISHAASELESRHGRSDVISWTDSNRSNSTEKLRRRRRRHHRRNNSNNNVTSERSSSDVSLLRKRESDAKKKSNTSCSAHGTTTTDSSVSTSDQLGHRRNRPGISANRSPHRGQHHQTSTSVPKFGSWDVNDPKSGDGLTIIFDKLKEEKQINASLKLPALPPPPPANNYLKHQSKQGRPSFLSKICCCLFPSRSERVIYFMQ